MAKVVQPHRLWEVVVRHNAPEHRGECVGISRQAVKLEQQLKAVAVRLLDIE
jgi:hypothetical protein